MSAPEQKRDFVVEMFHRINRLRQKVGAREGDSRPGFIDPGAIARAEKIVENKEVEFSHEMASALARINDAWANTKIAPRFVQRLRSDANNIKDLADTYHYQLMAHFGESLRDFCEKLDVNNKAHHVIVQAHIDAMLAAHNKNIRAYGGTQAQELKDMVAKAIAQHS
ncbi:MAG TPA: hypothetical protein VL625_06135 [Patescibacteria group bacterium]|nr:hypothetical protein [Patescibacteria group bacterium]